MKHRWTHLVVLAALALGLGASLPAAGLAAKSPPAAGTSARAKNSLHQFTGVVTALDKQTLTVEKQGKQPLSRTFVKHEEMSTTGELAKDARVTVYFREESGKAVAHRVVVKAADGSAR